MPDSGFKEYAVPPWGGVGVYFAGLQQMIWVSSNEHLTAIDRWFCIFLSFRLLPYVLFSTGKKIPFTNIMIP